MLSIENDPTVILIAQKYLGDDRRVNFWVGDGGASIDRLDREQQQFDLIFADTWAGKYTHLSAALSLLKAGGLYIIDDMLPQANWPQDHEVKVATLIETLEGRNDLTLTKLNWASGIIIGVKK